jgi:outer membrane protein TolC
VAAADSVRPRVSPRDAKQVSEDLSSVREPIVNEKTTPARSGDLIRRLSTWLFLTALAASASAVDDPSDLADEALAANPGLEALRARVSELDALASAAGAWSDPVIGVEYSNVPVDSFSLDEHPMSALQLQVQQTLPPWGWSGLRERVAASRTLASEHALSEAQSQLRREVMELYWRLTLSRMLEEVTREHVARTEELLEAVRARYETGAAGQHQLLRLGVLRDRLRDELGNFSRADRVLSAALSRVLSRDAESSFATPPDLDPRPVSGTVSEWLALAREERAELKRLGESVRTAEAGAELARVEGRPEVLVWMKYRARSVDTPLDDGTDQVSAGFSIPIPWGSAKRSRAERAAQLQLARAGRARLSAEEDRVESDLAAIHARWQRAFEQAVQYRDHLTPDARAALETSLSDYTVGRADFATLFEAQVTLLDLERTLLTSAAETRIQAAAADAAIGTAFRGGRR